MHDQFRDIFTPRELMTLASIVQVGDATYRELMETQRPMFGHPYFDDTRGRIRTKVVQVTILNFRLNLCSVNFNITNGFPN